MGKNPLSDVLLHQIHQLEDEKRQLVTRDRYRLKLHLMPPVGWLNDPNGLCQFKGLYHVFFQYSPFNPNGGLISWGHYISSDLVNWEYTGPAILPDQSYDCHGAYSGSAFIEDDTMYLYYTGNIKEDGSYDYIAEGRGANTVLISTKDGKDFGYKQCIMTNADYPEDYTCHVRDPKVFKENDTYYMVQGGRRIESKGAVLLYSSADKIHWDYEREYTTSTPFGYMWECPDLFEVNEQWFLSVSPQGLKREEFRYQNVYQSGYFTIDGGFHDGEVSGDFHEWDMGFDFYAPQTFLDENGRRILIGWIGMPDSSGEYTNPTIDSYWQNALTVPREVRYKNQSLMTYPVKEIDGLRNSGETLSLGKQKVVPFGAYDLLIHDVKGDLSITLVNGLTMMYENGVFSIHMDRAVGFGRNERNAKVDNLHSVRVLIDTSVLEIYLNDGETVFTTRYYSDEEELQIRVIGDQATAMLYKMDSMTFVNS